MTIFGEVFFWGEKLIYFQHSWDISSMGALYNLSVFRREIVWSKSASHYQLFLAKYFLSKSSFWHSRSSINLVLFVSFQLAHKMTGSWLSSRFQIFVLRFEWIAVSHKSDIKYMKIRAVKTKQFGGMNGHNIDAETGVVF